MYFAHTDEQEEFRATLRRFFENQLPHAELPALLKNSDLGTRHWAPMAQQLGIQGLAIAEDRGGSGFGLTELSIVIEEAGRALMPEPLFATLYAGAILESVGGGGPRGLEIVESIAAGECIATVAVPGNEQELRATPGSEGDWRLTGEIPHVIAGQFAEVLLVVAPTDRASGLFAVDASSVAIEAVRSFDTSRPQATIRLDEAHGALLVEEEGLRDRFATLGALLLAAEQVGGAGRCLDVAVEHVKIRTQFGRTLGSFQAVKHRCADMLVRHETARTALMYATWAWESGAADAARAASAAKAAAGEAYWDNARDLVQLLGGIGFTAEHPAQLHFKRATVSAQLFGSADAHREAIVASLVQGAEPAA